MFRVERAEWQAVVQPGNDGVRRAEYLESAVVAAAVVAGI